MKNDDLMKKYIDSLKGIGGLFNDESKDGYKLEPKLEAQDMSESLYKSLSPEKIQLIEGKLYGGGEELAKMFAMLLYNLGIEEAIKFAPRELWLKALENYKE